MTDNELKQKLNERRVEAIGWTIGILNDLIADDHYLDNDPEFMRYLTEQLTAVADELRPKRRKNARHANVTVTYGLIKTRQDAEHGSWTFSSVAEAAAWLAKRLNVDELHVKNALYNVMSGRNAHYRGYTISE